MLEVATRARAASLIMRSSSASSRNAALSVLSDLLSERSGALTEANAIDLESARVSGLDSAVTKRLVLDANKVRSLREGLSALISMDDPLGVETLARELSPGLELRRLTCALGVIGVVFEARPEAVIQIAALAIKSGNAVILKGGKEAAASNAALGTAVADALRAAGLPSDAAQMVASREELSALLQHDTLIDLVIPRGSAALVKAVKAATRIPVLGHADGICHVYLAPSADKDIAARVVCDSKINYPAACNAAETLLIDEAVPQEVVETVARALLAAGVTLHVDTASAPVFVATRAALLLEEGVAVDAVGLVIDAVKADWDTEWLALHMSVARVANVVEAIAWVNRHGSHHTDAVVCRAGGDGDVAGAAFVAGVDSASVFVNASTRFADGFRFGFGAEVGVSTGRIHSRGPVGVDGLLTYRYQLVGEGHVVAQFNAGKGEDNIWIAGQTLPTLAYTHVTRSGR